jgi:hypothetical protein
MRETRRAFDARLQAGRRRRARKPLAQNPAQGVGVSELRGQQRIGGNLPADRECVRRIKLAVRIRVNQKRPRFAGIGAGHARHELSVLIASIMRRRARARRDITVPTGTAVTSAISRYSSP